MLARVRRAVDGDADRGDRRRAVVGLDHDLGAMPPAEAEQRRGPRTVAPRAPAAASAIAPAAARGGPADSAEQITRIRSAYGG